MQLYEHVFDFVQDDLQLGYPEFYATIKVITDSPDLLGGRKLEYLLRERGFTSIDKAYPVYGKRYKDSDIYLMYGVYVPESGNSIMTVNISQDETKCGKYDSTNFTSTTFIKNETVYPISYIYNGQLYEHVFDYYKLDLQNLPTEYFIIRVINDSPDELGTTGLMKLLTERDYTQLSKGYPVSGMYVHNPEDYGVIKMYGIYIQTSDNSVKIMGVSTTGDNVGTYTTSQLFGLGSSEIINPLYHTN